MNAVYNKHPATCTCEFCPMGAEGAMDDADALEAHYAAVNGVQVETMRTLESLVSEQAEAALHAAIYDSNTTPETIRWDVRASVILGWASGPITLAPLECSL